VVRAQRAPADTSVTTIRRSPAAPSTNDADVHEKTTTAGSIAVSEPVAGRSSSGVVSARAWSTP
jgi:hypothetical protein